MFGSDYPFLPDPIVVETIKGLQDYEGFDAAARAAIERGNALSLFPRLAVAIQSATPETAKAVV